jgi:predicted glycosyltransferase
MRIWIDLAAPPQVQFFRPIWRALRSDSHELLVTVRDFGRAPEIAARLGIPHRVVGRHGGRGTARKAVAIVQRAGGLVQMARQFRPDVAVSHNSYAQALAAQVLRVPLVTAMDYEHQPANHVGFRLAHRVLVPDAFPQWALSKYGAPRHGVVRYPGIKEEVYLSDFAPRAGFRETLGVTADHILVTMRPPARSALYHRFDNPLFDACVEHAATAPRTHVIVLDRSVGQRWRHFANVVVPATAVDGPNLIYWSDVVIGAGGTMNREATVLGTPAYNVYAGRPSAVDDYLVSVGRMRRVVDANGVSAIALRRKESAGVVANRAGLDRILGVIRNPHVDPRGA